MHQLSIHKGVVLQKHIREKPSVLVVLFLARALDRESFQVTVLRSQGLPYAIDGDVIRNLYTVHLQNKTDGPRVYFITPAKEAFAEIDGVDFIIPQKRIALEGLGDQQLTLFAMMPKSSYSLPEDFNFTFTDSISGVEQNVQVRFRGP